MKVQSGISLQPQAQTGETVESKMREAAKMYEDYFLNEMVKAMRKTVDHSGLTKPNFAENMYSEQLDQKYVEGWANRGGVGLADLIYNQLHERFYNGGGMKPVRPEGPIPLDKGTTIKVDETRPFGIPVAHPRTQPGEEVSFLFEWDKGQAKNVTAPYRGEILQAFRSEDRQTLKIKHDDGLLSTISFLGQARDFRPGDQVEAGNEIGKLAPNAFGLTWQIGKIET